MAFFWFFRLTFLLWLSALVNHSGTQTTQLSSPTSSTQTTQLSSPTSGTQTTPLSSPTSGTQTTPVSSPTSGTQTTLVSSPTSGTQTTPVSSPTSNTQTTPVSSPTSGTQTTPVSSPTSGTLTTPVSSPTSGTQTTPLSSPTSGTQTTPLSSPTSGTQTTPVSSPTSGTQTTPVSSPTSGTQTTPVSSPTSGTQTTVTSATATINTSSFHETTAVKTTSSLSDRTTVSLTAEVTTHSETTAATNLHRTTVVTTKEGCGLSEDSCTTNGVFLKESCECLCKKGFAGVICEVSTEKNPCTENPDLCQERGQYCESDTKITDGKEYVCKCNSLEGYVQKDGKCIEEEPFTTKLDVTRIDGKEATYKPAHRDINSAESRKVLDAVIPVIRMSLKNDPATETVIDVVGIRLENGSIGVTTMVIFPKEENVKEGDLTKVLKKEKLGNASVEIELKQEKFNVSKPQSAGCSSKYCSNDGTCRLGGVFPDLRPSCSCARDFYGPTCDSVVLTPFIIAMITFGTVAFLILAGVLVFCLFVRARGGRHKAGEKVSRADRLYASAWKTGPDILSHYLTEELDDKEADSETELSSVSDERMDQLVKDLKGSSFQMKRAKSVYQWESVKFNKPPSQPRYADNPSMLELKNSRDRRWYTSSNI